MLSPGSDRGITTEKLPAFSAATVGDQPLGLLNEPLALLEILGRTTVDRMLERLLREDLAVVSVLVDASISHLVSTAGKPDWNSDRLDCQVVDEVWAAISRTLKDYSEGGIDRAVIATAG